MNGNARITAINGSDAGKTLLDYLAARFTYLSAEKWAGQIGEGRLLLNDDSCTGNETLREGDRVSFTPAPYDEPPVNTDFTILAEDERFLFIDKPPLLPCHPGGIYLFNTLWGLLRETYGNVSFINRLDRETAGIVVAAKTKEGAAWANALMSERKIDKEYLVIVEGAFPEELDAEGFLVRDEASPVRKKLRFVRDGGNSETSGDTGKTPGNTGGESFSGNAVGGSLPGAVSCHTRFSLQSRLDGNLSLVHAKLFTGRTHQIRATLQSLGFPVVGDKLYGKDETIFLRFIDGSMTDADRILLRQDHQALLCSRIVMPKMDGGTYYDIVSRLKP